MFTRSVVTRSKKSNPVYSKPDWPVVTRSKKSNPVYSKPDWPTVEVIHFNVI